MEKLVERHEALTRSVEHLAKEQTRTDQQLRRLGRYIRSLAMMVVDHEARLKDLEGEDQGEDED